MKYSGCVHWANLMSISFLDDVVLRYQNVYFL